MLVPAILYKEQIIKEVQKLLYTKDITFLSGDAGNWVPQIKECPDYGVYQYAIVDGDKLIGYFAYDVDYYSSNVYNFGLVSYVRGSLEIGKSIFPKLEELVSKYHRIQWRMVKGNPVERSYDKFCQLHNGRKLILKDCNKDTDGNYIDSIIYEIINENVK